MKDWLCAWPLHPWLVNGDSPGSRRTQRARLLQRRRQVQEMGLRAGDRVGWWPQRTASSVLELLALLELGVEVPCLPLRAPALELEAEALALGLRAVAGPQQVLPNWPHLGAPRALPAAPAPGLGQRGTLLLRSSGSMGGARWVRHRVESLVWHAQSVIQLLDVGPGDCWQLSLPLDHVGGLAILLRALCSGCALALPPDDGQLHSAASWCSLVPAQLADLVEQGPPPAALRGVLLGGAPLPERLASQALQAGWPLWLGYGSTETGSAVCLSRLELDGLTEAVPAGRPVWPHRVWLEGRQVVVHSPCLGRVAEDATASAGASIPPWRSGDLARWHRGQLCLWGRADRVIISGGEKIVPERVETALLALPEVRRAVVVACADARWGQRPVAFVQWVEDRVLEQDELRQRLTGLPRLWHPDHFLPWPAGEAGMKVPLKELERRAARLLGVSGLREDELERPA